MYESESESSSVPKHLTQVEDWKQGYEETI